MLTLPASATVTLRPAGPDDTPLLAALFAADRPPVLIEQQYASRAVSYAQAWPSSRDQVVELDGLPVGRVLLGLGSGEWRIVDVSVLPEHRNAGVGTATLQRVLDDACDAGLPVTLRVDRGNPAQHLYERLGFAVVDEEDLQYVMRRETR